MLTQLPGLSEALLIAFARVGALMMALPAFGERTLPMRLRLLLALFVALMVVPEVSASLATSRADRVGLALQEVLLGLAIGTCGRITVTALEMAGSFIATTIGLSFAQALDPAQGQQTEIIARFLRMFGVALIFAADLHHYALTGIVGSYQHLPVGSVLPAGDLSELFITISSGALRAALGIAAPFLVFGFVFNAGLGLCARLAPQIQIFFLAMPASVVLGLAAMALVVGAMGVRFEEFARSVFLMILPVG